MGENEQEIKIEPVEEALDVNNTIEDFINDKKVYTQDPVGVEIPEPVEIQVEQAEEENAVEEEKIEPSYNVSELLKRHEEFKAKGLQLTDDDLFNWLSLMDEIITVVGSMKAERTENKLEQDKEKALRSIELKMEKDAGGKTVNTDKMIEALIKMEFYEKDLKQATLKSTYELLYQRAGVINDLVNVVKLHKKADFTL